MYFSLGGEQPTDVHLDITLPNVLLKLNSIDEWTEEEIYERLGEPRTEIPRTSPESNVGESAPRYIVEAAAAPDERFLKEDAFLIDLGVSFLFDTLPSPEDIGVPLMYRAPEVMFEEKYDHFSDVWSLGCLLFEIRAGTPLISSFVGAFDDIVRQWVQTKGRLPSPWWESWDARAEYFDERGKPLAEPVNRINMAVEYTLAEKIAEIGTEDGGGDSEEDSEDTPAALQPSMLELAGERVPQAEASDMEDLLDKILQWKPEERLSCEEILKHPWLASV